MSVDLTRRAVLSSCLGTAAIAVVPALAGCAAPAAAPAVLPAAEGGGAAAVGSIAALMSSLGHELGLAVAANGIIEIAKALGQPLVDDFLDIFDSEGNAYEPADETQTTTSGTADTRPAAFVAVPLSAASISPMVSLVSTDGHRIDLLPRAGQALASVATGLGSTYGPHATADLLLPVGKSRSQGGGRYERRSVTWPVLRGGWVTIQFRPALKHEVVTVSGLSKTWLFDLDGDLENVVGGTEV